MNEFVLAIDDTGFATNEKHFESLKSEECCFCSVAVSKNVLPTLNEYMQQKTNMLYEKFGTREFHFTDIYNRKGNFENIDIEETLDIVRSFALDIIDTGMILTVSTINKHSYTDPKQVALMNMIKTHILPKLNLPVNNSSVNLILNIIRSDISLNKIVGADAKITDAYCDEGLRKIGNSFKLGLSKGDVNVSFESSESTYLLQFADFVAWFVTRTKHILDKHPTKVKEWEKELLQIYSTLPFSNMENGRYLIGNKKTFNYDKAIENLTNKQKNQE